MGEILFPLRQATAAYRAVVETLASAVLPVAPRPSLREQVVNRVADEAAREPVQLQGLANTLALNAVPVTPRASLRERVMARVEGHTDVRLDSFKGLIFVKASEGVWQEMASGVSAKVLYFDLSPQRDVVVDLLGCGLHEGLSDAASTLGATVALLHRDPLFKLDRR